jgi:hypothetical protein
VRAISDRFKAALSVSHQRVTRITCTVPGGSPVAIGASAKLPNGRRGPGWTSGKVSSSSSTGVRYQASLSISPAPGQDTYAMVSTPGAIFRIDHGIDFGAGNVELVNCGVYEAARGSVRIAGGDVSMSLVDLWQRIDRCRFLAPFAPPSGTRASLIATAVANAVPGVGIYATNDGGQYVEGDNVWDRDRPQFINDMAKDGSLDVGFDAAGEFRIRKQPVLDPATSVWTFRTGAAANLTTAERERPFNRHYNTVIVEPMDASQAWDQQVVQISDLAHPLHPSKVGVVPFFYKSATANDNAEALQVAVTTLQQVAGSTETVNLDALSNPALEVGDVVTIAHPATDTDPGFGAVHILDSWSMDLDGGAMSLATRSSALPDLQEN